MTNLVYATVSLELEDSLDCPDLKIIYGFIKQNYLRLLFTPTLIYKCDSDSYFVCKHGCIVHCTDISKISSNFPDGGKYFIPSFSEKSIKD